CYDTTWSTIASEHCNGSRQSPINIVSASAVGDETLTAFTFTKYGDNSTMKNIKNTGKTVPLEDNAYDSLPFHLHWGNGTSVPGSEHTVQHNIAAFRFSTLLSTPPPPKKNTLTSYLAIITLKGESSDLSGSIMIIKSFLKITFGLGFAVVWTVFKDHFKVSQDLVHFCNNFTINRTPFLLSRKKTWAPT
uniref:Alpha-carbonic anhydrase domain-containing protein n=1 Tax=Salmo trutta TaxID=8032 RepID=A0A673Z9S4_SALTR